MAESTLPTKLVPLKWVVSFEPASIGLVYKLNEKDKKRRLYKIELNDLIDVTDSKKVAARLFLEHPLYLNKKVVQLEQVAKLVDKIHEFYKLERGVEEEESQLPDNLPSGYKDQYAFEDF